MVLLLLLRKEQFWRDANRTSSAVLPLLKTFNLGQLINKQESPHVTSRGQGEMGIEGIKEGYGKRKEISEDHFEGLAQLSPVTKPPTLCTPSPKLQTNRKKGLTAPDEWHLCTHIGKGKNL